MLSFWHHFSTESNYDGGVLEISTDGGLTWTYLTTDVMGTDPYDGPIDTGYSNPLIGFDAWCGDPQNWLRSVVDLTAYAGQTVRIRFRLGTDVAVGRPGWDIDDVEIRSCFPDDPPLVTKLMREAGYDCGLIGKLHLASAFRRATHLRRMGIETPKLMAGLALAARGLSVIVGVIGMVSENQNYRTAAVIGTAFDLASDRSRAIKVQINFEGSAPIEASPARA